MKREDVAKRRDRVLRLHAAGLSYPAIARQEAEETGKPPRSNAAIARDIGDALRARKDLDSEGAPLRVVLQMERLDTVRRVMEQVLRSSQGGRCPACGRGGEPQLAFKASAQLMRIAEREAALLGLDKKYGQPEEQPKGPIDEIKARRDRKMRELSE